MRASNAAVDDVPDPDEDDLDDLDGIMATQVMFGLANFMKIY